MKGRRYSDGLHQAIEAKEGLQIQRESHIGFRMLKLGRLAEVSYVTSQNVSK